MTMFEELFALANTANKAYWAIDFFISNPPMSVL